MYLRKTSTCILLFCAISVSIFGQGIQPRNLIETGLNLGYWSGHQLYKGEQNNYSTWAGNANAEWLSSWPSGYVKPLPINIENPDRTIANVRNQVSNLGICQKPYYVLRESILELGISLSLSMTETSYSCSQCLKDQLQKAAVAAQTIGQILDNSPWQDLAQQINISASKINTQLQNIAARNQNSTLSTTTQAFISEATQLLPNIMLSCETDTPYSQNEPIAVQDEPAANTEIKKRKRRSHLTGGATSATLHGENGTLSQPGSGFYVALDGLIGDPVFLLLGASFYRNSAGSEYFIPGIGQVSDPGEYLQSFQLHVGLGGNVISKDHFRVAVFGAGRLFTNPAIDGELLSLGNAVTNDNSIAINMGTYISYGVLSLHTSYSLGMLPIITVNGEEMRYRMWQFGLGITL